MSDFIDPLNLGLDLAETDTSMPSMSAGLKVMRITNAEKKPWAKDPTKSSLVVTLETINEEQSTQGLTLSPGFKGFYRMNLQPTEGFDSDFRVALAKFFEAATGDKNGRDVIGKIVLANYKVSKNQDPQYSETEINYVKEYKEA